MSNHIEQALWHTQQAAALRENASTQILKATYQSNGYNMTKAISAAMMTIGGLHAPIKDAYSWINACMSAPIDRINFDCIFHPDNWPNTDGKVPGFGSGFIKGDADPLLHSMTDALSRFGPEYLDVGVHALRYLQSKGKNIYPNLAFYTACVARITKININLVDSLVILPRVPVWVDILKDVENNRHQSSR